MTALLDNSSPAADQPAAPYTDGFYDERREGSRNSARRILPLILGILRPASAIDVGCGTGTWLRVLSELGVADVHGVDGEYVDRAALEIPADRFTPFDLQRPLNLGRRFDLVMSLEVAEHLPASAAEQFVESLTSLGDVVLFSAAIPEQGGTYHVNEQWPEYWAKHFLARGYRAIDVVRPAVWADPSVDPWYAQNTILYAPDRVINAHPALRAGRDATNDRALSMVHPGVYLNTLRERDRIIERERTPKSLRQAVAEVPPAIARAVGRRMPGTR